MCEGRPLLIAIIAALLTLGACVSTPSGDAPERRAAPIESSSGSSSQAAETAQAEEPGSAAAVSALADRRRSDYPDIQTDATGFTITEQIRIPGDTFSQYEQALTLLRQERYQDGIRLLEAITEDAPEITAPWVELGIAYEHIGDLESAAEALEFAAALSPEHPIVHNELGIVYRRSGRFAEARSQYEQALAVFSDFHYARRNLAVLCDLYLADIECALANYRAYLESAGEDPEVEIWVADLTNRSAQGN